MTKIVRSKYEREYLEGIQAGTDDKTCDENPYKGKDVEQFRSWMRGWVDGHRPASERERLSQKK